MRKTSWGDRAIAYLTEHGPTPRKMLSSAVRLRKKDGTEVSAIGLSSASDAFQRLVKDGYVELIPRNGKKYAALTDLGRDYVKTFHIPFNEKAQKVYRENKVKSGARSTAAAIYSDMGMLVSRKERPTFPQFMQAMGGDDLLTDEARASIRAMDFNLSELLMNGIYFPIGEILEAINRKVTTRCNAVLFNSEEIIFIYTMYRSYKKNMWIPAVERQFADMIDSRMREGYERYGKYRRPDRIIHIISGTPATALYLTDCNYAVGEENEFKSSKAFTVTDAPWANRIHMIPSHFSFTQYRYDMYNYSDKDIDAIANMVNKGSGYQALFKANGLWRYNDVEGNTLERFVLFADLFDLTQLKEVWRLFDRYGIKTIVVCKNNYMADIISRILRERLDRVIDSATGDFIDVTHYNEQGKPLIKNTTMVDHRAKADINIFDVVNDAKN